MVDHSTAIQHRAFLGELGDLLEGGIEAAIAFNGVPVGLCYCLAKGEKFPPGLAHVSGRPGLQDPLGAVEEVLLPGDRNDFDAPSRVSEPGPKLPVSGSPGPQLGGGPHAGVDVGENGPVLLDGDRHLDVEIPDAAVGPSSIDAFRQQLKAGYFFLWGSRCCRFLKLSPGRNC